MYYFNKSLETKVSMVKRREENCMKHWKMSLAPPKAWWLTACLHRTKERVVVTRKLVLSRES